MLKNSSRGAGRNGTVKLKVKFGREDDGRYFALIPAMPGVAAYGKTKDEALRKVQALALRVLAEDLEEGTLYERPIKIALA